MKLYFLLHTRKLEEAELLESPAEVRLFAAALFSNAGEKEVRNAYLWLIASVILLGWIIVVLPLGNYWKDKSTIETSGFGNTFAWLVCFR